MKKDWLLFTDIVLIVLIGLTTLYSTVVGTEAILGGGGIVNRQLIFILIGFGVYFAASYFDYRFTGHPQVIIPLYVITALLLAGILLFGIEINNARRWIVIGNYQIQPSEIAKLVTIMSTAWILSLRNKIDVWKLAGISFVLVLISALLIFLEPDAGTSLIVVLIWGMMVFVVLPDQLRNALLMLVLILSTACVALFLNGNIIFTVITCLVVVALSLLIFAFKKSARILLIVVIISGVFISIGGRFMWDQVLADYQKQRIETFINPEEDTEGAGFQVDQSKVAIGSGLLFGKGFGHGTQSKLNFLPEHQTDFVFASFAEEFGLVGSLFVIFLYAFAVFRIFHIALGAQNMYGALICIGVGVKIMVEVFVNIGMNIGMLPATGVPLPLMSAGGSIFLITMIAIGLAQSVKIHQEAVDA